MFGIHGTELWFILAVVVLLFGGKKIPELMRGVGKGIREFNSAKSNLQDEFDKGLKEDESKKLPENK
ncbi:MAG TPA: twin-arginine translocase TatA/TatE family subunit [Chitinophagales bacterium]|jgi:sec-independent protein translocase protein TatA|nr:twin-arginine translocase TatA/TatE family subunit [Chitinophagales bacterium]MBP6153615.1 twin-arginine translocase TatA/TatE family subunit [Chitinophagales bacterium]HQV77886.1 twin-arginine translocase TatA/TatE family subunit [Chitinophagales bacterium]HQW78607.1 twin-arginine translocase TatA/TatE family subunit [Chitinophagales bacterium]HRB19590.1 twin-arginine translocase TatA/TatE family subunit [Chitinophagales bacterium]